MSATDNSPQDNRFKPKKQEKPLNAIEILEDAKVAIYDLEGNREEVTLIKGTVIYHCKL